MAQCVLLERVSMYQNQIRRIEGMEGARGLKELNLQDNQIKRVENISRLVNL